MNKDLRSVLKKKDHDKAINVWLRCDGEVHKIVLAPNGRLGFCNHTPEELNRENIIQAMGGELLPCSQFHLNWLRAFDQASNKYFYADKVLIHIPILGITFDNEEYDLAKAVESIDDTGLDHDVGIYKARRKKLTNKIDQLMIKRGEREVAKNITHYISDNDGSDGYRPSVTRDMLIPIRDLDNVRALGEDNFDFHARRVLQSLAYRSIQYKALFKPKWQKPIVIIKPFHDDTVEPFMYSTTVQGYRCEEQIDKRCYGPKTRNKFYVGRLPALYIHLNTRKWFRDVGIHNLGLVDGQLIIGKRGNEVTTGVIEKGEVKTFTGWLNRKSAKDKKAAVWFVNPKKRTLFGFKNDE